MTRELSRNLARDLAERGRGDAAREYAQQIPVRVIANVLGIPADMADTFTGWVRDLLEFAPDAARRTVAADAAIAYFREQIALRRVHPGGDPQIGGC